MHSVFLKGNPIRIARCEYNDEAQSDDIIFTGQIRKKTMAETKTDGLFDKSTMSRISSADDLDHYVKVTNPSAWIILIAALLLVGGILVWALVAVISVTMNTTGALIESTQGAKPVVMCVVDKATADKIEKTGAKADINGIETTNVQVNSTPASSSEITNFFGSEFYAEALKLSDWNYMVTIVLDEEPKHSGYMVGTNMGEAYLVPVNLTIYETQPINILLGKN